MPLERPFRIKWSSAKGGHPIDVVLYVFNLSMTSSAQVDIYSLDTADVIWRDGDHVMFTDP